MKRDRITKRYSESNMVTAEIWFKVVPSEFLPLFGITGGDLR